MRRASVKAGGPVEPRGARGLLAGLSPEAFEAWVGDRLRVLGYAVRATPPHGDHGADLLLARPGAGEGAVEAVVQCKHRPRGTVGEPVLRDLFGAMYHFGAARAVLVTTGRVTPAARAWLRGKPIEAWDAQDLRARWAAEIAQTTAALEAAAPPVSPGSADGPQGERSGWYVYTEFGRRFAVRLPRWVGDHPLLGYAPLTDPATPILNGGIQMRLAKLSKVL